MSEEELNEAIQYNLDYLEGNIDFEEEYKELAKSYSNLYDKLQQKENIIKEVREYINNTIDIKDVKEIFEHFNKIEEILDKEK